MLISRFFFDRGCFCCGELCPKPVSNRFSDLALNREHVVTLAIITFSPKLITCPGVNQLRAHLDVVARALNAALHDMSNSESIRDLTKIALHAGFVLHHRVPADHS